MKVLIVICVVILLLQIGVLGLGVATGEGDQPSYTEIENGDWDPDEKVPTTSSFNRLLRPFRPRLKLPFIEKSFAGAGTFVGVHFHPSSTVEVCGISSVPSDSGVCSITR